MNETDVAVDTMKNYKYKYHPEDFRDMLVLSDELRI